MEQSHLSPLARAHSRGIGPIRFEDLEQYSPAARRSALGLHLTLASSWRERESLKLVLKREFPRIVAFLLFRGRAVPQDAGLVDAIDQCPSGGLILIQGSHFVPILHVQKSLRLEGVGGAKQKALLRTHFMVKPAWAQGTPVLSRSVTAEFRDVSETITEDLPSRMTVQLHALHLMQPIWDASHSSQAQQADCKWDSSEKVRDPDDVDKAFPNPKNSLLWIGDRARVQATQCLFEEAADSSWGCGIYIDEAGRLEAVDSVIKNAEQYGIVTFGTAKLSRCRVMGSAIGARMAAAPNSQLVLKGCIFQDNREIGIYLPPVWFFNHHATANIDPADASTWPFRCIVKGSSIIRSWYPVAQKTQADTKWERYPWVESPHDFVGLQIDSLSELQELTENDYDPQVDLEDDRPPSRCPSSLALSDTEKYWDIQEDWEYQNHCLGPTPPLSKQKPEPQPPPKGSKRHHGPKW